MLRFSADENLDIRILQGLRGQAPEIDVVRVQDAGLQGAPDPVVLEWAAAGSRLLPPRRASVAMTCKLCQQ